MPACVNHEALTLTRELGEPSKSEFTVVKVDAYNDIQRYLEDYSTIGISSIKDVVEFNDLNEGTEGPNKGDHPAFASGQV